MQGLPRTDLDHVLEHTSNLWPKFRGARLFVTGGTGFVGKWLLESLIAADKRYELGVKATVLTRDTARFREYAPQIAGYSGIDLMEGDVRDFVYPDGDYSHIVHAATDMAAKSDPLHTYDVIVGGTRRVLQLAADRDIENLLLISSGAVYGRQPSTLSHIPEDYAGAPSTASPQTAYGQGKRAAEFLMNAYAAKNGLRCRIARLFAVSGPYLPLDAGYAAGNFVRDAIAGPSIKIGGDGTPLRSYLYAADMAIWLWTILGQGQPGMSYNVGAEQAVSIKDLALRIAALVPSAPTVECAKEAQPGQPPELYVPSTALARSSLSLEQWISLEEGLRRMIAWNRSQLY